MATGTDGGDWPRTDQNLSFRFSELTITPFSRDSTGRFNHTVYRLTDSLIDHCPFIMMTGPGGAYFSPEEAEQLHDYLLHGGFLWADDCWASTRSRTGSRRSARRCRRRTSH